MRNAPNKVSPNWSSYQEVFPQRYWEEGLFDELCAEVLGVLIRRSPSPLRVLDVGSGMFGSPALRSLVNPNVVKFSLDPGLRKPPKGYQRVQYTELKSFQFDLILCRGSINYLNESELKALLQSLDPKGVFLANTFLKRPEQGWYERPCQSTLYGKGIERSRITENDVIEHELCFDSVTIAHQFFYRSPHWFKSLGLEVFARGSSSSGTLLRDCAKQLGTLKGLAVQEPSRP